MEIYDFIIVGAGSSGCVLADRLSANGRNTVLLVEAGPADKSMLIHMPRGIGRLYDSNSPHIYNYEVRKGGNRGVQPWIKGRGLGGSSSVNGMIYSRGHPQDYDDWEAMGATGWGWKEIGRAYREMEGHALGEGEWRGGSGPLKISMHTDKTILTEALIAAGGEMGTPMVEDVNDAPDGGIGYQPRTVFGGRRMSAARAFLKPALRRKNLTVATDTQALRIVFDGTRATALDLRDRRGDRRVGIGREVILSAGALESPRLLQLSGVGPAGRLQAVGVPVVADAPNVGRNLREHLNLPLKYRVATGSFSSDFRGPALAINLLRFQLFGTGPTTHAAHEVVAFVKSRPELSRPDARLGFTLLSVSGDLGNMVIDPFDSVTIHSYYARPSSQGHCQIRSADPSEPMEIDANYLDTEEDRRHAVDTLRFANTMMGRSALAPLNPRYEGVPMDFESDDSVLAALGEFGSCAFHICGTCRMGSDAESVVDPQLRVRGVTGVRVLDTSVMPLTPTGNTNAPAMAIAWRGAELILGAESVRA